MNFGLNEDQQLLRDTFSRFFDSDSTSARVRASNGRALYAGEDAAALSREVDEFFTATLTSELKAKAHYSWDGHDPQVHRKHTQAGLLFPELPAENGGRGATPYASHAAAEVWEDYGWSSHAKGTTMMVAAIIDRFGSDELKRDVLRPILAGEAICSLGYSEPRSGSNVFVAQAKAVPGGNGWRIDGTKMFTGGADISDCILLLTRTNTDMGPCGLPRKSRIFLPLDRWPRCFLPRSSRKMEATCSTSHFRNGRARPSFSIKVICMHTVRRSTPAQARSTAA